MISVDSAGVVESTDAAMKTRKPLNKISERRKKQLESGVLRLGYNSTIRRKPCNAQNAKLNYKARITCSFTGSTSVSRVLQKTNSSQSPIAKKSLRESYGKQRKPINRQSAKQKVRLQKLAAIRLRWWNEAQSHGKTLICGICDEEIRTREELESDHIEPGHGKADEISNLQPSHGICNQIKGSQRNFKIVRGDRNWKLIHGML